MTRKKLPIGSQTFAKIRGDDDYDVDTTPRARRSIEIGSHHFVSRPRRFGKSLFLDTLAELFAGNEPLFRGLYLPRPVGLVDQATRPTRGRPGR